MSGPQSEAIENVWADHIANLRHAEMARPLGMLFALATEVFALKAEVKRLRLALTNAGSLTAEAELDAGETEAFAKWLGGEQTAFAKALLQAWLETDQSPDVSGEVEVGGVRR